MGCDARIENCSIPFHVVNITREPIPEWEAVVTGVVLSFITLLTLTGNVLVVLSVFTYKPLRIPPNYFIASLAVTDILVALTVFPFSMLESIKGRWILGATFCKVWLLAGVLCCSASIFHLCAIALDRFWAIRDPIGYSVKRTVRRIRAMICLIWICAGAMSCCLLFGAEESDELIERLSACLLKTFNNRVVSVIIGFFYVTLFLMTIAYAGLFVAVRRSLNFKTDQVVKADRSRSTAASTVAKKSAVDEESTSGYGSVSKWGLGSEDSGCVDEDPSSREDINMQCLDTEVGHKLGAKDWSRACSKESVASEEAKKSTAQSVTPSGKPEVKEFFENMQRMSQTRERKLARTLGIVMGAFLLCWLPFFIMYVVIMICNTCQPTLKWRKVIIWLTYINSTLNPIIYTVFNAEFRSAFKKLLHL
ncbi:tyramine receptor 1-like [Ischnura elegans]|uniref:tyramine receptor 1-like n=1 Tax=Ischnura elegans TaxID=197161 RepID=UPI001ED87CAC|nr:tyramine receptor 1-like [Ischnura elegans]XP_046384757.1 tyramine receptor 1-like [Ischnura elegans]